MASASSKDSWADAQADLCLCLAHISFFGFVTMRLSLYKHHWIHSILKSNDEQHKFNTNPVRFTHPLFTLSVTVYALNKSVVSAYFAQSLLRSMFETHLSLRTWRRVFSSPLSWVRLNQLPPGTRNGSCTELLSHCGRANRSNYPHRLTDGNY